MKSSKLILFFIGICNFLYSQQHEVIDSLYLEDQLYISAAYTFLTKKPENMKQVGVSGEFSGGFVKDIPFNKRRNIALGVGIGYAYNFYNSNLKITKNNGTTFSIVSGGYDTNRLHTHFLEFPIELRWRNSRPTRYSFFRIYGGVKFSYLLHSKVSYADKNTNMSFKNIPEIQKFQYGLHFVIGYGAWNLYTYYALQPFLKDAVISKQKIDISRFTIGLKFYML